MLVSFKFQQVKKKKKFFLGRLQGNLRLEKKKVKAKRVIRGIKRDQGFMWPRCPAHN